MGRLDLRLSVVATRNRNLPVVPPPAGGQTPPARPPVIARNLMELKSVARELGRLYRQMRRGAIPSQEATRAAYVLGRLSDVLELVVIERRLEQLEKLYGDNSR